MIKQWCLKKVFKEYSTAELIQQLLTRKDSVEEMLRQLFENEDGQNQLLRKVFQTVDWYDDDMDWTPERKRMIIKELSKHEHLIEYLHYLWARDRKQLFDLVGIGKKFSREDQLIKYGAMARVSSMIAQLRAKDD